MARSHSQSRNSLVAVMTAAVSAAVVTTVATATIAATATVVATIAATTIAAAEATASRTIFTWASNVHHHVAAAEITFVQAFDCSLSVSFAAHFHKGEALGATGVTVHHYLDGIDSAELREFLLQVFVTNGIRQIANVQFVVHFGTFRCDYY